MPADDLRLQPKMTTAAEVAVLVKLIPIELGADLIEQYARTVAAQARVEATIETNDRMLKHMDGDRQ